MISLFLKQAFRRFKRDFWGTILLCLLPLVGIASFAIIITIYENEVTYDHFMPDGDKIFRLTTHTVRGDQESNWAITNGYLPTMLKEKIPEVEQAMKFLPFWNPQIFKYGDKKIEIPKGSGFFVDPHFFEILDYPLLIGDQATALKEANSIIMSQKYAMIMFGRLDVIGETVEIDYGSQTLTTKVTGVLEKIPSNSHLQFDFLIPGHIYGSQGWDRYNDSKAGFPVHVYFKTSTTVDEEALGEKIQKEADLIYNVSATSRGRRNFPIQSFLDIHFNATNLFEPGVPGNLTFSRILFAVGIIILVISTINFSILYTSKSLIRAKEIGVRKTLGSNNSSLVVKLLGESTMITVICSVSALLLAELLIKTVVKTHLYDAELSIFSSQLLTAAILGSGILLGVISGLFITFKSTFESTVQILKGGFKRGKTGFLSTRNLLIVFQFILTSSLITASFIFFKQLHYIKNKDLGYTKEAVINLPRPTNVTPSAFEVFRTSLLEESTVASTGYSLYPFLGTYNAGQVSVEHNGDTLVAKGESNYIDPGLASTLGLEIVEGRNFSQEVSRDSNSVLINEAAKRTLGLDEVVGKTLTYSFRGRPAPKIIGVVKDFHFASFVNEIAPLILYNVNAQGPYFKSNLMIRIASNDMKHALDRIEEKWDAIGSGVPFEPKFLENDFRLLITKETKLVKMISTFTVITIMLACLGLVGLVGFTNEQRKKEVGIRKVYGATEGTIVKMINSYFGKMVVLALALSIPASVYGLNLWLKTFAYHTEQGLFEYSGSALLLLFFAIAVTSLRTLKTARSNPVDVLKEE